MGKVATLRWLLDVNSPNAAKTFDEIGIRMDELDKKLRKTREISVGDRDAMAAFTRLDAMADRTRNKIHNMPLTIEGATKAEAQLLGLEVAAGRLDKKLQDAGKANFLTKMADSGSLGFSGMGTLAALSPAAIPVLGAVTAAVGGLAISLSGAAIGAGAFGLMAKSAFSQAATAANAVEQAQNVYDASIDAGTKKATAYRAEQKAIALAYAQMTPQQIALSKAVGNMQNAWQGVQQATTPLISGTLVPWIKSVELLMKDVKPFITPVADVFKSWGQTIHTYFSSSQGSAEIHRMAVELGKFSASQLKDVGTFIFDIGKGIFNLGKDLAAGGANFNSAGSWLANMGKGFASWSSSAKARKDVQGLLHYLHTEGPVITSILKDLAKYIPGIFAGATTVGTLELKALSSLLNLLAKLPPSIAKPLTEIAGAALLLSKTGVLKVGLTVAGKAWDLLKGGSLTLGGASAAAEMETAMRSGGAAAAAEIRAAFTGGGATSGAEEAAGGAAGGSSILGKLGGIAGKIPLAAAAAAIAAGLILKFREDLKSGISGVLKDIPHWFAAVPLGPLAVSAQGWADTITTHFRNGILHGEDLLRHQLAAHFDELRHDFSGWWDDIGKAMNSAWNVAWNNTIGRLTRGINDANKYLNGWWHDIAHWLDNTRHGISSAWDTIWNNTVGRFRRGIDDVDKLLPGWWHNLAHWFDTTRHDIASVWDLIWNNTVGRAQKGISDLMHWVGTIPGKLKSFFSSAGHWLYGAGQQVIQGLYNGFLSIWHKVTSWISSIAGWIKAHKGPVSLDATLLEPAGRALMSGLHIGLLGGFGPIAKFISGIGGTLGSLISGAGHGIASWLGFGGGGGSGVQRWAGLVAEVLKMLSLPASYLGPWLSQMQTESGGNPTIVNRTDSNWLAGHPSVGLVQVIRGTFDSYAGPFRNTGPFEYGVSVNPLANVYAGINYWKHAYNGNIGVIGHGHGYATGTLNARPGWALVGERGPELVRFRGGEQVLPHGQSPHGGGARGPLVNIQGDLVVREQADANLIAQKLDFRIQHSWMG